ncbi:MAG: 50S ribosomal protein L11 methyltransferase [Pseudolabrys sp.]
MPPTTMARLTGDEARIRRVAALVGESVEGAVTAAFESADGGWAAELHFSNPPDQSSLRALVASAGGDAAAGPLQFETVHERDWVAASLAGLSPIKAGRFVVHGAHDRARVAPNAIGIEIEAALAFGTGHHGTTRGCLLALDGLVKRRQYCRRHPEARASKGDGPGLKAIGRSSFEGRHRSQVYAGYACYRRLPQDDGSRFAAPRILDVGTGSGVLAIAAARLFHRRVVATDIDPVAVAAAKSNARLNRAATLVNLSRANGTHSVRGRFDLIFANILLGPLLRMAYPLARLSAPGGHVVLSGLLPSQANAVLAAYRAQGFALERRILLDGWITLLLRRPKRKPPQPRPGRFA